MISRVLEYKKTAVNTTQNVNASKLSKGLRSSPGLPVFLICPHSEISSIQSFLSEHPSISVLDNFDILPSRYVLLYFQHEKLADSQKDYLNECLARGQRVDSLINYIEKTQGYTEISLLTSSCLLTSQPSKLLNSSFVKIIKQSVESLFAALLLILTFPVMLLTAVAIKVGSEGPIFYRQARVGQFNKEFDVIKFRSMSTNAEEKGAQWATKNDPRVTRVGRFIRCTRIDELPQLLNVLRGEMSLIGPRPERRFFIEQLEQEIPYYSLRHAVKPGITGLAQVKYAYGSSLDDAMWKHRYDMHYIKNYSLWLDFKIFIRTVKTVILALGN
ncbi:hypothetical protein PULV_a2613 [Pseudoalteromonas ulvae UL12]|uniref:Bacterial sugar transferase domain-containing protein n=1 Tax=Pseudoalteromonas ulvae TaxID=107327 RepID=A0A244CP64_PSEDV|nr:sugar transferase [Pseudoalteromonas ulvae]MBE0364309.1 hypothetical protein [Pseudoalteromonas ulvae UL12]OUL57375.1 hypothetical protein B1199_14515 [Pseudoalteromonas ulvae]